VGLQNQFFRSAADRAIGAPDHLGAGVHVHDGAEPAFIDRRARTPREFPKLYRRPRGVSADVSVVRALVIYSAWRP